MANRSIVVRLKAEISEYLSSMRQASQAARESARATEQAGQQSSKGLAGLTKLATDQRESWDKVSSGLTKVGVAGVAGLGLVTKAAMDWESAWTGVQKTVDGTPQQMKAVEEGLRGLTKVLPASHQEIAAVAEAAGQLGIATPDVVNFTRTMLDLGESTNLSAEEAATSLARFMNIMGTSSQDVSRLGSTLVGLGNNFATTEAEIMAMSMRLAGTGNQIGLTEGEVMGLSAAMSSVGIEAEAGGTAMSMTMSKINTAVKSSSTELGGFAKVAGMSAEDFARAWAEDPAAALDAFVQGVGRAGAAGEDVNTMLDELGIKGVREIDTLLRLGGAAGLLGEAFEQGNSEFAKNSALAEEAAKRYATTESQVRIAWNGIKDAAIDAGAVMLPVVQTVAEAATGLATTFSGLPGPVQGGITALGGIAAVSALVVGGGMKMVTMAADASEAMTNLGISSGKTKGLLGAVGKAAGVAMIAFAGFELAKWAGAQGQPAVRTLEEIGTTIRNTSDGALELDRAFAHMGEGAIGSGMEIKNLDDAMNLMHADGLREKMLRAGEAMGVENEVAHAKAAFEGIDATLAQMTTAGSLDQAAEGFAQVAAAAEAGGYDIEEVARTSFPAYMDALRQLGLSYDYPLEGAELMAAAAGELPPALVEAMGGAEGAAAAMEGLGDASEGSVSSLQAMADAAHEAEMTLSDLFDSMFALGLVQLDAQAATGAFHEALRATTDAVGEATGALRTANGEFDVTTEAGYAAQQAFAGVATSGMDMAEAAAAAGGSVGEIAGKLSDTYNGLVTTAEGFGFTAEQAAALAREALGVPDNVDVETWMSDEALRVAAFTGSAVKDIPADVDILSWMSDAAFLQALRTKAAAEGIPEHEAISSFMDDVARDKASQTTAAVLGIPEGASVQSWMDANAENQAWRTKGAIDAIPRSVEITTTHRHLEVWEKTSIGAPKSTGPLRRATGGPIPAYATGGRLPVFGPGTDKRDGILGVSSLTGEPTAYVDKGEWVINGRSSSKYDGLLRAINNDDPRLQNLPAFATGERAGNLRAAGGEMNLAWSARWETFFHQLERTIGKIDRDKSTVRADGSGVVKFDNGAIVKVNDGLWKVTKAADSSAKSNDRASKSADRAASAMGGIAVSTRGLSADMATAGLTLNGLPIAANAVAGTFREVSTVTAQAAKEILAATSRIGAQGQTRGKAMSGGLIAREGEKNAVWRGRHDQFEQAIAKKYGGIKYSDIHEDGSGQIVLDDGRKIELNQGRWQFVKKFKYGAPARGRTLSKYAGGGRLPETGMGTDSILGVSSEGTPVAWVDDREWVINRASSDKYNALLSAVNRDDPAIRHLARHAAGARAGSREYAAAPVGFAAPAQVSASVDSSGIEAAVERALSRVRPMVQLGNRQFYGAMVAAEKEAKRR